jgi:AAA+ ATPase superfamily predicted ATPase
MPGYLLQLSDQLDIWANLRQALLRRDSLLYAEPDLLLREELREPRMYAALLRAIAEGAHRLTEITQRAGFADRATATRYLDTLRSLGLAERRLPISVRPAGQQWGTWHLADPYLRFWGRWILPYTSQIEFGEAEGLIQESLRPQWDRFVAITWEELARQHVYRLAADRLLPFWPEEVGSWWSGQAQVDVVGVHRGRRCVLLGEARWRREPMNNSDLAALRDRARLWLDNEPGWDVWYALFSRSGFTADLQAQVSERLFLLTPTDVTGLAA